MISQRIIYRKFFRQPAEKTGCHLQSILVAAVRHIASDQHRIRRSEDDPAQQFFVFFSEHQAVEIREEGQLYRVFAFQLFCGNIIVFSFKCFHTFPL